LENWGNQPEGIRQHLIDRMRDRAIGIADLNELHLWIESKPEVPTNGYRGFETRTTGANHRPAAAAPNDLLLTLFILPRGLGPDFS